MEQLDDAIRRAAPPPLGADAVLAEESREVARGVAVATARPRVRKWRRAFGGSVLTLGSLGLGVTGAVAGPALFEWVGWTPDASAQRTFVLGEDSRLGPCEVVARVVQEGGVAEQVAELRTESARQFLAEQDWDALTASITAEDIAAKMETEQARRTGASAEGVEPPEVSAGLAASLLMGDRMRDKFMRAGHLQPGVSLEMSGRCDAPAEGREQ